MFVILYFYISIQQIDISYTCREKTSQIQSRYAIAWEWVDGRFHNCVEATNENDTFWTSFDTHSPSKVESTVLVTIIIWHKIDIDPPLCMDGVWMLFIPWTISSVWSHAASHHLAHILESSSIILGNWTRGYFIAVDCWQNKSRSVNPPVSSSLIRGGRIYYTTS